MGEIDTSTIDGLKATLVMALEQGDAGIAAALYEHGARLLPPGGPAITGADAVRAFWEGRIAAGSDGGALETVHREEHGGVAVEEGRYRRRSGEQLLDSGKYLVVFRRQRDGTWRYATDIWNSDAG
jgi:ketosteroid isomerase-like protein